MKEVPLITPGLMVGKGHVPFVMMMLLDVLRAFPGQVHLPASS